MTRYRIVDHIEKAWRLKADRVRLGLNTRLYRTRQGYCVLWSPRFPDVRNASKA